MYSSWYVDAKTVVLKSAFTVFLLFCIWNGMSLIPSDQTYCFVLFAPLYVCVTCFFFVWIFYLNRLCWNWMWFGVCFNSMLLDLEVWSSLISLLLKCFASNFYEWNLWMKISPFTDEVCDGNFDDGNNNDNDDDDEKKKTTNRNLFRLLRRILFLATYIYINLLFRWAGVLRFFFVVVLLLLVLMLILCCSFVSPSQKLPT